MELNQSICPKDVLTSEWKPATVLHCGHGFVYVFTGNEKVLKLTKIRIEEEKSENLGH